MPITSVRVGLVPGTHELVFDAPFEQIRLVHEARDRRVFADGALVAARMAAWRASAACYTMRDVLAHRDGRTSSMNGRHADAAAAPRWSRRSPDGGEVDEPALRALVDWQIAEGIHFLVPCGSPARRRR